MIGSDPERLRTASPRRRAAEIRVPVLLAHGEDDDRQPKQGSLTLAGVHGEWISIEARQKK